MAKSKLNTKYTVQDAQILLSQQRLLRRSLALMATYTHMQELCVDIVHFSDEIRERLTEIETEMSTLYEKDQ